MSNSQPNNVKPEQRRLKKTVAITLGAIDALTDIQRKERRKTGSHLPEWKILDAAIRAYASQLGIPVED